MRRERVGKIMSILLVAAALAPAIGLLIYTFAKDRVEKEPIGLLLLLFGLGVASVVPAVILETIGDTVLNAAFSGVVTVSDEGTYYTSTPLYYLYNFLEYFLVVALSEETVKWLIMFLVTGKNKNFNCLFDGVVYSVFVSLGFAAAENVMYVLQNGFGNAIMRALTAVPAHMFFAVIMGYFYSYWHLHYVAGGIEKLLIANRVISVREPYFKSGRLLFLSLLVPILCHGFYDFCATIDSWVFTILFFAFLIFLYVICFIRVHKLSKLDAPTGIAAISLVLKRYPASYEYLRQHPMFAPIFEAVSGRYR